MQTPEAAEQRRSRRRRATFSDLRGQYWLILPPYLFLAVCYSCGLSLRSVHGYNPVG